MYILEELDSMNIIFSLERVIEETKSRIAECEDEGDKIDLISECNVIRATLNKVEDMLKLLVSLKGGAVSGC